MYSKINAKFWVDEKTANMTMEAKFLMMYLLTNPYRNIIGCYFLKKYVIKGDTGLDGSAFESAWEELLSSGMVIYDEKSSVVLIKHYLKYNQLENPSQIKSAISKLDDLPRTELIAYLADYLEENFEDEKLLPLIEALRGNKNVQVLAQKRKSKLAGITTQEVGVEPQRALMQDIAVESRSIDVASQSITMRETGFEPQGEAMQPQSTTSQTVGFKYDTGLEPMGATIKEIFSEPLGISMQESGFEPQAEQAKDITTAECEKRFEKFWSFYPKKTHREPAKEEFMKIAPDDNLLEKMLNSLTRFMRTSQWRSEGGRYIPNPVSWLKDRRWLEKVVVPLSETGRTDKRKYTDDELRAFGIDV